MQNLGPEFEAAAMRPVDHVAMQAERTEWIASELEHLAARIRRHGCVDGTYSIEAEQRALEPRGEYCDSEPTGRYTHTLNVMVDRNQELVASSGG